MSKRPIGLLGGTFDPVHNGHLRLAIEVRRLLDLAEIRLIPCAQPPHRDAPSAAPGQRAKWVRVAVANEPGLRLDDRELLRDGPSYTVDTLASLRAELPDTPLCLIMGTDVFATLPGWHEWQQLFDYAHIVLINRPGDNTVLPDAVQAQLDARRTDIAGLGSQLHGAIHCCEPPPLDISGSRVRQLLASGHSPRFLVPDTVLTDIVETNIYSGG